MIKNRAELLSHGFVEGRQKVLDIAEHALRHVDPRAAVRHYVKLEGNRLQVGEDVFDLNKVNNIYAIGGGKATYPLAIGLEEILGDRITDGFVARDGAPWDESTTARMTPFGFATYDLGSTQTTWAITGGGGDGEYYLVDDFDIWFR